MAGRCGMSGIRQAIDDYLAVRRALGYKLEDHGWLLAGFASYMETAGAATITTRLALAWATLPEDALPSWHAARLRVVRSFARHRGPPGGLAGLPQPPGHALPVLRRRGRRPDGRHGLAAPRPARRQPQDPARPAGRDRHAARGGDPPGPDRPGRRRGDLDDPGQQIREKQADPAAPEHARRAGRVRAAPRSALSRPQDAEPAGVHRRDPADQPGHPLRLRPAGPPGRPAAPLAGMPAPAARLPPLAGGEQFAGLVPRGRRRPAPAAGPVHHARPHRPRPYLLVL